MNKIVVIADGSTYKNPTSELSRLESTFSSFKNEHLSEYADKIRWVISGTRDILSSSKHDYFYVCSKQEYFQEAQDKGISTAIVSLSKLSNDIQAKLGIVPDVIIYSSNDNKDFDDFDTLVNTLGQSEQQAIRKTVFMLNMNCFRKDIIIPKIITALQLDSDNQNGNQNGN